MDVDGSNRREVASGAPGGSPVGETTPGPAWSPDGKTIAFERARRCRDDGCDVWEVMLVDVEDGGVRRIANAARTPTWSPNGALVAFEAGVGRGGVGSRVDVISPDGSGRRRVALGREPLWSPRGDLIAYERSGVGVVRPDGSGARRLFGADLMLSPLAWSADGSRLAFALGEGIDQELFWAAVDGPQSGRLTRLRGVDGSPSWSPDGKLLAWSHELDLAETDGIPAWYLYVGGTDGSPPRRLVPELYRGGGHSPAWTPDGAQVLYTAHVEPGLTAHAVDIHSVGVDGGPEAVLRTPMREWLPAASPDGDRLAFYADEESGSYLYVSDADGRGLRRLAEGGDTDADAPMPPAWSPDGSTLAFVRDFGCADRLCTTWEIWLVGVDGSGLRRLVTGGRGPHWSPDGRRIAYTRLDGYVHVISPSGPGRRRLQRGFLPQWSPRGDRISYIRRGLFTELRVVRPDGTEPRTLASDLDFIGHAWSPSGRDLAFTSFVPQRGHEIFEVDVETRAARPLVRQPGPDYDPVFAPDGKRLAWVNGLSPEDDERNFVHVARANGTAARRVTKKGQIIGYPLSWSANGRIYFTVGPRRTG